MPFTLEVTKPPAQDNEELLHADGFGVDELGTLLCQLHTLRKTLQSATFVQPSDHQIKAPPDGVCFTHYRYSPNHNDERGLVLVSFPTKASPKSWHLTITIGDGLFEPSITFAEPIMTDGWNHPDEGDQLDQMLRIIDRWIDLTKNQNITVNDEPKAGSLHRISEVERFAQNLISGLMHASRDWALTCLDPYAFITYGGRYHLPSVRIDLSEFSAGLPPADLQNSPFTEILTGPARHTLASMIPNIVRLKNLGPVEAPTYCFFPWSGERFKSIPEERLPDQTYSLEAFPKNSIIEVFASPPF